MKRGINYYWRVLATGACFTVFGLGCLWLWAFLFPVLRMVSGKRRQERVRFAIHKSFGFFLGLMEFVGLMRMEVEGAEKLKTSGGELVLSNHLTLIDFVVLVSLIPHAGCVVKQEMWKNFFTGGIVRAAGYISNADPEHVLEDCAKELEKDRPLLVFPQGTRGVWGHPSRFQRGAAYIALKSRRPIRPVLLDCFPPAFAKGAAWYHIPPRPFRFRVRVLELMGVEPWTEPGKPQTVAARSLTQALESFFNQELSKWKH